MHTSLNVEEMCKMQYKCTIYSSKPEDKFVVQAITDFNKDELIDLIELISVE